MKIILDDINLELFHILFIIVILYGIYTIIRNFKIMYKKKYICNQIDKFLCNNTNISVDERELAIYNILSNKIRNIREEKDWNLIIKVICEICPEYFNNKQQIVQLYKNAIYQAVCLHFSHKNIAKIYHILQDTIPFEMRELKEEFAQFTTDALTSYIVKIKKYGEK